MESSETGIRILNRDVIKYIAMFTMLLNHISHMFLGLPNHVINGKQSFGIFLIKNIS